MSNNVKNITVSAMEEETKPKATTEEKVIAFNPKNYLNLKLDAKKGETHKEIKIRVLPIDKNSNTPFKRFLAHNLQVDKTISESGYKSYTCLEKTDDVDHDKFGCDCPCCQINRHEYQLFKEATDPIEQERHKKNSIKFMPTEYCAMRVIERGAEEDGPKFLKFSVRADGKDLMNMILKLYKTRRQESIDDALEEYQVDDISKIPADQHFEPANILDLYTGKDLQINVDAVFDKNGNRTNKTSITIIDCGKEKPLTRDDALFDKWVNDDKVWTDVFAIKPYDYLRLLIEGKIPYFNKKENKWVELIPKDQLNKEKMYEEEEANDEIRKAEEKAIQEAQASVPESSDLPF